MCHFCFHEAFITTTHPRGCTGLRASSAPTARCYCVANQDAFPTSRSFRVAWHRCACYHRRRRSEHPRTGPSTHTLACVSCVHPEAGLPGCRQYEITPRTIFHSGSANSHVPSTVRHLPDGFLSATGMGGISPASPPLPPSQAWLPLAVFLQV